MCQVLISPGAQQLVRDSSALICAQPLQGGAIPLSGQVLGVHWQPFPVSLVCMHVSPLVLRPRRVHHSFFLDLFMLLQIWGFFLQGRCILQCAWCESCHRISGRVMGFVLLCVYYRSVCVSRIVLQRVRVSPSLTIKSGLAGSGALHDQLVPIRDIPVANVSAHAPYSKGGYAPKPTAVQPGAVSIPRTACTKLAVVLAAATLHQCRQPSPTMTLICSRPTPYLRMIMRSLPCPFSCLATDVMSFLNWSRLGPGATRPWNAFLLVNRAMVGAIKQNRCRASQTGRCAARQQTTKGRCLPSHPPSSPSPQAKQSPGPFPPF